MYEEKEQCPPSLCVVAASREGEDTGGSSGGRWWVEAMQLSSIEKGRLGLRWFGDARPRKKEKSAISKSRFLYHFPRNYALRPPVFN